MIDICSKIGLSHSEAKFHCLIFFHENELGTCQYINMLILYTISSTVFLSRVLYYY